VNNSLQACIDDLSLCLLNDDIDIDMANTSPRSLEYMAPELLQYREDDPHHGRPSFASELYAFGTVIWEVSSS
jgi:serine/threonine protein kinase